MVEMELLLSEEGIDFIKRKGKEEIKREEEKEKRGKRGWKRRNKGIDEEILKKKIEEGKGKGWSEIDLEENKKGRLKKKNVEKYEEESGGENECEDREWREEEKRKKIGGENESVGGNEDGIEKEKGEIERLKIMGGEIEWNGRKCEKKKIERMKEKEKRDWEKKIENS